MLINAIKYVRFTARMPLAVKTYLHPCENLSKACLKLGSVRVDHRARMAIEISMVDIYTVDFIK